MKESIYYAVLRINGPVFGIGKDEISAKFDAIKHISGIDCINELEEILVEPELSKDGDFTLVECSKGFFEYIEFNGGEGNYKANNIY